MASVKDKIFKTFIPLCGYCGFELKRESSYQLSRNALTQHHLHCAEFESRPIKGRQHRDAYPRTKCGHRLIDVVCPLCRVERRITNMSFQKSVRNHPNNPELIGICNHCQTTGIKPLPDKSKGEK